MLHTLVNKVDFNPQILDSPSTKLEDQVGNTPLIELSRLRTAHKLPRSVRLFGKAEWFNPSGSVKDRAALNIIRRAEKKGELKLGMTILDSTSGNMGIALAMFGAARGYRVKLAVPENASPERIAVLRAYGTELIFTDPLEGSDGAQVEAQKLAAEADESTFFANQYNNPANWQAHYHGTADEIWNQTAGRITHFIAGTGTSGTLVGTSRRLKELNPDIKCVGMQPDGPFHGLEGLKHLPTSIKPGIFDAAAADWEVSVKTESAYQTARELARVEGLFVGISAAAAVTAALEIAQLEEHAHIVAVLPDSGYKYLSDPFWGQE